MRSLENELLSGIPMASRKKLFPALTILLLCGGCGPLPMSGMKDAFQESLRSTVGQTLETLQTRVGQAFIGPMEPTEIVELPNGNLLYRYGDFYGGVYGGAVPRPCKVELEFEPVDMRVVSAASEGEGCYHAY